ncbi:MAG: LysR family transcriptional regulator [Oligoflexia bacterium]|nr:LysR family transcriptional regulator [Oligoflexia bacterium]
MQNLKDINWNHLYCFYEVGRAQSLKKGAETLNVASSTISTQIKSLEKNFGSKLFVRSSKGLTLTKEGEELFERSRIIFEEGHRLLEHFSDDVVGGYPVSIGIEESISYDLATELASQYWDIYTSFGTVNTVRQSDHNVLTDNLMLGNLDWGISLRKPKRKDLSYEEIGSFEIFFCCSSDLFDKFKDTKDLLVNIPFAENNSDQNLNESIYSHLRKNGIIPKEKIYSDHTDFLQKLCLRGRCITCLPKNPLEDYKGLKTFRIGEPLKITLYSIWKKSDEDLISIKKLKELLSSSLAKLPSRYEDVDLQIEVSDVSDDLLK